VPVLQGSNCDIYKACNFVFLLGLAMLLVMTAVPTGCWTNRSTLLWTLEITL